MMHKAWCSIEEVPYYFSGSSIKFQGYTGWKIDALKPIWVRLLGRSQLSNPSDLPCLHRSHNGQLIIKYIYCCLKKGPKLPYQFSDQSNSSLSFPHSCLTNPTAFYASFTIPQPTLKLPKLPSQLSNQPNNLLSFLYSSLTNIAVP